VDDQVNKGVVGGAEHVEERDIYIGLGCGNLKRRKAWKTELWMGG